MGEKRQRLPENIARGQEPGDNEAERQLENRFHPGVTLRTVTALGNHTDTREPDPDRFPNVLFSMRKNGVNSSCLLR